MTTDLCPGCGKPLSKYTPTCVSCGWTRGSLTETPLAYAAPATAGGTSVSVPTPAPAPADAPPPADAAPLEDTSEPEPESEPAAAFDDAAYAEPESMPPPSLPSPGTEPLPGFAQSNVDRAWAENQPEASLDHVVPRYAVRPGQSTYREQRQRRRAAGAKKRNDSSLSKLVPLGVGFIVVVMWIIDGAKS